MNQNRTFAKGREFEKLARIGKLFYGTRSVVEHKLHAHRIRRQ